MLEEMLEEMRPSGKADDHVLALSSTRLGTPGYCTFQEYVSQTHFWIYLKT